MNENSNFSENDENKKREGSFNPTFSVSLLIFTVLAGLLTMLGYLIFG